MSITLSDGLVATGGAAKRLLPMWTEPTQIAERDVDRSRRRCDEQQRQALRSVLRPDGPDGPEPTGSGPSGIRLSGCGVGLFAGTPLRLRLCLDIGLHG